MFIYKNYKKIKIMEINDFIKKIIETKGELVILSLNLPEIHKLFQGNSVALCPSGQFIATTAEAIASVKGDGSWIDLLSQFWSETEIESRLSADQVDFPVIYYPSIPFEENFFCFSEEQTFVLKEASRKALMIINALRDAECDLPEKYLDLELGN